ncbi:hypothetical protein D0962_22750 [Leptolyngbyaceae cyanobacterium CCMR0082]|uniref:Uncharacterized protein n=1 Tax=Adonisia turfae CCMR0082 TaxID=2304604 RepID=A0A6M0SCZ5_9CYAN|nr:hypothetical protein [Adonisia turfae]NEZ65542.1 hypothetical protein [Adonisia turfae CCMR0082]
MSEPVDRSKENKHAVTDPELCYKMGKKYGWDLKDIRPTGGRILKVNCVFYGEQTSFEDTRYGD